MPRATKKSSEHKAPQKNVFVLQHGDKRVVLTRPKTYEAVIKAVRRHFPHIPKESVILQTDGLDVSEGNLADIDPEVWGDIVGLISSVHVKDGTAGSPSRGLPPQVASGSGAPAAPVRRRKRVLRKPVIYLFSPADMDAVVTLSLAPEWSFSVIYPVVSVKRDEGEQIQWDVRTRLDGSLLEKSTNLAVAYLFWEARPNSDVPISPPASPTLGDSASEYFNPSLCDVCDAHAVVVRVKDIAPYLDGALTVLGLHIEARTSFITYWLPDFLKHSHIALHFIPQAAYERAAAMQVSPQPDVVTLFKGVPEHELHEWPQATARGAGDVQWLTKAVGVDLDRASDTGLFRVLEWGGMEVSRQ
ncbi:hypothetical protein BV22DRAFT_1033986 [Leucogyrophana mollusca]|uniref:Uncharacterized protein n=1 Tax=Leucogyrophana mollusca TaxID=85980 RepID=A0ACB8BI80_9AGAM|nr:hypothetical protein BV22DRAFT_1033986 [Leucogyrophana mollusca]